MDLKVNATHGNRRECEPCTCKQSVLASPHNLSKSVLTFTVRLLLATLQLFAILLIASRHQEHSTKKHYSHCISVGSETGIGIEYQIFDF